MKIKQLVFNTWIIITLFGCADDPIIGASECVNGLTAVESEQGWRLLFDGASLENWRSYQEDSVDDGWAIENGCLARVGWGGDLISRGQFADFELKLEWRISEAGNSGIFIRGDESGKNIHQTGYEMQVLDNVGHSDNENPTHRAGAYYDMIAPDHDTTQAVGYWNRVHIVARGAKVEFWLNEKLTAKFAQGSTEWQALYDNSKFTDRPQYGTLLEGHIGFQDHFDKVWYRNIRILPL
jgi:hypothetical protein